MVMQVANKTIAYVLWLFFGLFGAHRFYVGRWQSGLVWMFTLGLLGIGWIIDGFLLSDFVDQYNSEAFQKHFQDLQQDDVEFTDVYDPLANGGGGYEDGAYGQQQAYYPDGGDYGGGGGQYDDPYAPMGGAQAPLDGDYNDV